MPDDRERMQMEVETLFVHDPDGRLITVNDPTGERRPAPRFWLGRTRAGNLYRFRRDLPEDLVRRLMDLCAAEPTPIDLLAPPVHAERYKAPLEAHASVRRTGMGLSYYFPERMETPGNVVRITGENAELLREGFAETIPEMGAVQICVAAVEEGVAVSVCQSVRISAQAHEAGLETLSAYRRRGHAAAAVAGWAAEVRALGLTPFYSTARDNVASQGVARKLGLVMFGADFQVT